MLLRWGKADTSSRPISLSEKKLGSFHPERSFPNESLGSRTIEVNPYFPGGNHLSHRGISENNVRIRPVGRGQLIYMSLDRRSDHR